MAGEWIEMSLVICFRLDVFVLCGVDERGNL